MQREDPNPNDGIDAPKENFDENNPVHVDYVNQIFNRLNELYSYCNVMFCNCSYQNQLNYIRDSRIRFELVGIYYHRDDIGYINGDGTYYNSYCYQNYAICKDEVLNVFFCQTLGSTSGYGPPSHIMMLNQYSEYQQNPTGYWGAGNLLGHEAGHVFSLLHSWETKTVYDDICQSEYNTHNFCLSPEGDCKCVNNMMSYARISDFISPKQMAAMHRALTFNSVSKYLKTDFDPAQNVVITQPTVWDTPRIVRGDVSVMPGASLTITCKTIMAQNTRIIVRRGAKLIVDGATITTKGPTQTTCNGQNSLPRWTGIEVWGNSTDATTDMVDESYPLQSTDPGLVVLKGGARIMNAQVGVFAQQRGTPWSEQLQHFGGLILATDAEFINCRKAVEYIAHFPLTIPASFSDTRFAQTFQLFTPLQVSTKAIYEGVTSWQVSGLQFQENCRFDSLERGVVLGNATATVLGSSFTKVKWGVEMGMTSPMASKQTYVGGSGAGAGNTFVHCKYPVYATSYGFMFIYNNRFDNCYHGVNVQGASLSHIWENKFIESGTGNPTFVAGISLFQSGAAFPNSIQCNKYDATGQLINQGIYAVGENGGTSFLSNRFDCEQDVYLINATSNGVLLAQGHFPDQGAPGSPRFNEFTLYNLNNNNPDSASTGHKADIHTPPPPPPGTPPSAPGPWTFPFRYYPPTDNCLSRLLPRCPVQGTCASACTDNVYHFTNDDDPSNDFPSCSFGPIDGLLQPEDCRTRECLEAYYAQLATWDSLIALNDDYQLRQERLAVNNRKMALLHHLADSLFSGGEVEAAAQLWAADTDPYSREVLVGLRLQTRNYAAAAQLLDNYPTQKPEDAEFKLIQSVFLDYLLSADSFALAAPDSVALFDIAESYSIQSGYAQTLLKVLCDARFEPEYETEGEGGERSVIVEAMPEKALFTVYPNPAGALLNIEVAVDPTAENRLLVHNLFGVLVTDHRFVGNQSRIPIGSLAPGSYLATLMAGNGAQQTIRFIKSGN